MGIVNLTTFANTSGLSTAPPIVVTIPSTTAGNTLVVCMASSEGNNLFSLDIEDNVFNSYTFGDAIGGTSIIYYCENCLGGATTVTLDADVTLNVWIFELTPSVHVDAQTTLYQSGTDDFPNALGPTITGSASEFYVTCFALGHDSNVAQFQSLTSVAPGTWTLNQITGDRTDTSGIDVASGVTYLLGTGAQAATVTFSHNAARVACVGMVFEFSTVATGNIIIEKVTVPTGASQSFDFTTDYGSPFSLTDGQSNDSGQIATGTYSVTETPVTGWTTTTSQDPSAIVLGADETVTVIFTNTKTTATIVVQKVTVPSGSSQSFDFVTNYDSNAFSLTDGTSNTSSDLVPGTYSVSETPVSGWTTSVATNPLGLDPTALVLVAGDLVVVTFTNTQTVIPTIPCGKVLTRVDTWELDNGDPTWAANDSVPIAWYDSNLEQQKVGITRPSQNGTIGLLYIQLAATLTGAGVAMTIPDDWTPYVLWGALADLFAHDGQGYDPLRAKYCEQRYQEGVELARLVLKGV